MSKLTDKLVELAVITAEVADDETAVCAALEQLQTDNLALAESNAALVKENNNFKVEAEKAQSAVADSVIQAAIAEGKISEADKDTISFYRDGFRKNPEQTKKVLAALHPNPKLKSVVQVTAGDSRRIATEAAGRAQLQHMQKLAVDEVRRANPNLTYVEAFNIAKRDKKEYFPPESEIEA